MKKLTLFPKAPNKEIKIGNIIFLIALVTVIIFEFAVSHLSENQSLFYLLALIIMAVIGISFKLTGIIKHYRFLKGEIANGKKIQRLG